MRPARGRVRWLSFALVPAVVVVVAVTVAPPGTLPSYDRLRAAMGLQSPTGTVTGRALFKDQPLAGVLVEFHDRRGLVASSITDPDGSFGRLELPVGDYRVAVRPAPSPRPAAVTLAPRAGGAHAFLAVGPRPDGVSEDTVPPQRYGDPESSSLRVKVQRGEQAVDLKLTP